MIKKLIKILSIISLMVFLLIIYLSFVGIKTEKFNESLTNRILEINKKIKLDLKDIKFLLNPLSFTANIITKDSTILLGNNKIQIKSIKTNVSLKSLFFDKFLVDELQISTKPIMLNDVILLVRSFKDSTELFLLNKVIKEGFLVADIKLKFNEDGKVKKDYQINGFVKNGKLNFLNQLNVNNLNLNFNIGKNKYSLAEVNTEINEVPFSSPLIEINEKNNLFLIKGKILTKKKDFNRDQLSMMLVGFLKNPNIEKAKLNTENDISFNVSKKLKFNDLKIKSKINLDQLVLKNNFIDLKPYIPDLDKAINFENHEIINTLNY